MDLTEMHVWFRQYAQQMGMQNVRAILPEQIDVVINTSISDTVNELVRENVASTNDRIITDNSKIGGINALRTLIRTEEVINPAGFTGNTDDVFRLFDSESGGYRHSGFLSSSLTELGESVNDASISDALQLIDLSVKYCRGAGIVDPAGALLSNEVSEFTTWYPVRIIENMYLADTLQDFILKPRARSPIAVLYGKNPDTLELYLGKNYTKAGGLLSSVRLYLYAIRVNYLGSPAKVAYREDIGQPNINCDLPDYLHVDILKHAVDLYRISIQGSLYANQQQQQAQNREIGRNNVRPDNEGYIQ